MDGEAQQGSFLQDCACSVVWSVSGHWFCLYLQGVVRTDLSAIKLHLRIERTLRAVLTGPDISKKMLAGFFFHFFPLSSFESVIQCISHC